MLASQVAAQPTFMSEAAENVILYSKYGIAGGIFSALMLLNRFINVPISFYYYQAGVREDVLAEISEAQVRCMYPYTRTLHW